MQKINLLRQLKIVFYTGPSDVDDLRVSRGFLPANKFTGFLSVESESILFATTPEEDEVQNITWACTHNNQCFISNITSRQDESEKESEYKFACFCRSRSFLYCLRKAAISIWSFSVSLQCRSCFLKVMSVIRLLCRNRDPPKTVMIALVFSSSSSSASPSASSVYNSLTCPPLQGVMLYLESFRNWR